LYKKNDFNDTLAVLSEFVDAERMWLNEHPMILKYCRIEKNKINFAFSFLFLIRAALINIRLTASETKQNAAFFPWFKTSNVSKKIGK
jgi:hypothetical protein